MRVLHPTRMVGDWPSHDHPGLSRLTLTGFILQGFLMDHANGVCTPKTSQRRHTKLPSLPELVFTNFL
jgi:hypothetical protein